MDQISKLMAIRIKYDENDYSDQIPIGTLAENVQWDQSNTLADIIGNVDFENKGSLQQQIDNIDNLIGDLNNLQTEYKTSIVSAINENVQTILGKSQVWTGVCSTAKNVAEKQIEIQNFELMDGSLILIIFNEGNNVSSMTLNINNAGQKPVYFNGQSNKKIFIKQGSLILFKYFDNNNNGYWSVIQTGINKKIWTGICETDAAVNIKDIHLDDSDIYNGVTEGDILFIKFINNNTNAEPKLKIENNTPYYFVETISENQNLIYWNAGLKIFYYNDEKWTLCNPDFIPIDYLDRVKANINSPSFTGTPTATTPNEESNNGQLATTEFVHTVTTNATSTLVNKIDKPLEDGVAGQVLTSDGEGGQYWGTGSQGGVSNYSLLTNKPSINNITLDGNKTAQDLDLYQKPVFGIPKNHLTNEVQSSLNKANTALQFFTETDPTVPAWAKAPSKPTYTATEVGAIPDTTTIPTVDDTLLISGAAAQAVAVSQALSGKQDTLTFDSAPTANSENPVTSSGIRTALLDERLLLVQITAISGDGENDTTITKSASGVTDDMVVINAIFGTPSVQRSALSVVTATDQITISGLFNGSTSLTLLLGKVIQVTAV